MNRKYFRKIALVALLLMVVPSASIFGQRYLFYLHGQIIEQQGVNAVDTVNGFGAYQYEDILDAFRKADFTVLSEARHKNTNPLNYAHKIVSQVDSLIKKGIKPNNITIVGASKGAFISMLISSFLKNKEVNFVLLAGCNDYNFKHSPEIEFCGNILSIFEKSDNIGRSCYNFKMRSPLSIPHYKEIELNTGLKHGFLFKPLPVWVEPAIKWADNNYN